MEIDTTLPNRDRRRSRFIETQPIGCTAPGVSRRAKASSRSAHSDTKQLAPNGPSSCIIICSVDNLLINHWACWALPSPTLRILSWSWVWGAGRPASSLDQLGGGGELSIFPNHPNNASACQRILGRPWVILLRRLNISKFPSRWIREHLSLTQCHYWILLIIALPTYLLSAFPDLRCGLCGLCWLCRTFACNNIRTE